MTEVCVNPEYPAALGAFGSGRLNQWTVEYLAEKFEFDTAEDADACMTGAVISCVLTKKCMAYFLFLERTKLYLNFHDSVKRVEPPAPTFFYFVSRFDQSGLTLQNRLV